MFSFKSFRWLAQRFNRFRTTFSYCRFPVQGSARLFHTAPLNSLYKPFSITRTFQSTPETLRIEFEDSLSVDFHYIWLRDSCRCAKCVDEKTKRKLLDTVSLSFNISPRFAHVNGQGQLKIVWPEGINEHISLYDPLMLHRYGLGFQRNLYETAHDCLPPVDMWNRDILQENFQEVEYCDLMQTETGIRVCLDNIHRFGIMLVRNVPCETGQVLKAMNRIAHIKYTRWGESFHITTDESYKGPSYLQYETRDLELHTDMDYLEKSPGLQVIHCLSSNYSTAWSIQNSDKDAGKRFFVDGFHIASWLKENYPLYYETLASVPVKFQIETLDKCYANYQYTIKLNKSRHITEVHFNNRMRAPLEGPSNSILNFYGAYKVFGEALNKPENKFSTLLNPGDMIAFNNRRILHGRKSFDPSFVTRHLEGCFAEMDEVTARYRSFLMKKSCTNKE